jgi:50S ribosomal subunit-associated GTPase HflX
LISVLNKIDCLSETETKQKLDAFNGKLMNPVLISALHRTNFENLKRETLKNFENLVQASFTVPLTEQSMQFLSWVHNGANVKQTEYTGDSVQVVFEAAPSFIEAVSRKVDELHGKLETYTAP